MDQIDKRAYVEYLVWLAFTAKPWPWGEVRYISAHQYFTAIGCKFPEVG